MDLIKIIVVLFSLFALSRVFLRFNAKEISLREFLLWSFIWLLIIFSILSSKLFDFVSNVIGTRRPIEIIVYLSIVLIFYLIFRIYVRIERLESSITKIVREYALRDKK